MHMVSSSMKAPCRIVKFIYCEFDQKVKIPVSNRRAFIIPLFLCFVAVFPYSINGANILYFNQDCNVDLAGADNTCADERSNLLDIINDQQHNVTLLSGFNVNNLAQLLEDSDFLMIPDLEDRFVECDITDTTFLSVHSRELLQNYVQQGGSVLIAGSSQNIDFLNLVFQLNLGSAGVVSSGFSVKDVSEAQNTSFESCIDSIPNNDATFLINSTMPSSKRCIYGVNGSTSVAFFTIGEGSITYLGYDFNNAGPNCIVTVDVWTSCISGAAVLLAESGIMINPIPTLSEWTILILGLLFLIFGIISSKNFQYNQLFIE